MEIAIQLIGAMLIRLGLIAYGEWQDRTMAVKYTDVDYFVFHDAATFVSEGRSPYIRATYRYTPLLSWLLQPNILVSPLFGKVMFVFFDVMTGLLIYHITLNREQVSMQTARLCAGCWLFNPLPITVSSRGNAESMMSCLVLLCLWLLTARQTLMAGIVYGLAVHFKIYPVTYCLPIYLLLGYDASDTGSSSDREALWKAVMPTRARAVFSVTSVATFLLLTGGFYHLYGWEFLEHTYFYHLTRKDIRHNFSVYFYMLYLQTGTDHSPAVGLVTFIPQMLLLLVFSLKFYRDLALVFFLHTFAFVTFNKVCTSQYFLWYLSLLPLLFPGLMRISLKKSLFLVMLWFGGQGIWLYPAYLLEFQGQNTFVYIWLASLVFFLINCYIMLEIIANYLYEPKLYEFSVTDSKSVKSGIKPIKHSDQMDIHSSHERKTVSGVNKERVIHSATDSKIPRLTRCQARKKIK